jgi:hypothetical protein
MASHMTKLGLKYSHDARRIGGTEGPAGFDATCTNWTIEARTAVCSRASATQHSGVASTRLQPSHGTDPAVHQIQAKIGLS